MCGICGYMRTQYSNDEFGASQLRIMNDAMVHRGPDGEGIWVDSRGHCGLGHRRLAIIDLSESANQPMSNDNNTVVIVFNGEIYNHREIRSELEKEGRYIWKTDHSDTEVILHAYEHWGIRCIDRFRGMFAFAIWDSICEQLILVRDRMGIKPLYYTFANETLIFASEIKALLPILDKKPRINEKAVYDYLSFLCAPNEETMFEGIYKLRPSHYMICDKGKKVVKKRYYDLSEHISTDFYHASEDEIKKALLTELNVAVDLRKESDVPVGIFLSGGIDSSTNAALFSKDANSVIKMFCIGYEWNGKSCANNENVAAKKMAQYCRAEFYEQYISNNEWLEALPYTIKMLDEPIADPTCVSSYYVAKLARENGVSVAQVGEGADELFCGYPSWLNFIKVSRLASQPVPGFVRRAVYGVLSKSRYQGTIREEAVRRSINGQPVFWSGAEAFYESEKRKLISEEFSNRIGSYTSFEAIQDTYQHFYNKMPDKSTLNWMSYVDLSHRLPELLLMRADKMSMAVGLESRVPFLDHKFVELAMGIPQEIKIKNGVTKNILKETVRGVIPNEIINKKKIGFASPIYDTFLANLALHMEKEIKKFSNETGLLNLDYVETMLGNDRTRGKIWYLYNLAMWHKEYIA